MAKLSQLFLVLAGSDDRASRGDERARAGEHHVGVGHPRHASGTRIREHFPESGNQVRSEPISSSNFLHFYLSSLEFKADLAQSPKQSGSPFGPLCDGSWEAPCGDGPPSACPRYFFCCFITLNTGHGKPLRPELTDANVFKPRYLHQPSEVDQLPVLAFSTSAWQSSNGSSARLKSNESD